MNQIVVTHCRFGLGWCVDMCWYNQKATRTWKEMKWMEMKKKWKKMNGNERKWNESSQLTTIHNPRHNQSQMRVPYMMNWQSLLFATPELFRVIIYTCQHNNIYTLYTCVCTSANHYSLCKGACRPLYAQSCTLWQWTLFHFTVRFTTRTNHPAYCRPCIMADLPCV